MTTIAIKHEGALITGFTVSGHSLYSKSGTDIVCSSISTAVNMTVGMIEKLGLEYNYDVHNDFPEIVFTLKSPDELTNKVLVNFIEHIEALVKDYKKYVRIIK